MPKNHRRKHFSRSWQFSKLAQRPRFRGTGWPQIWPPRPSEAVRGQNRFFAEIFKLPKNRTCNRLRSGFQRFWVLKNMYFTMIYVNSVATCGNYPKSVLENTPFLVRFFHLFKPIFKNRFIFFWNVGSIVGWTHISRIFGSTLGFRDIEVLKKVAFTINAILRIGQIRRYSTNVHCGGATCYARAAKINGVHLIFGLVFQHYWGHSVQNHPKSSMAML